jgi:2-keto-4-pentenoate hydratase/2-oxohepta-3-ene-1,7-dioic acid hydratase in catechol pathway
VSSFHSTGLRAGQTWNESVVDASSAGRTRARETPREVAAGDVTGGPMRFVNAAGRSALLVDGQVFDLERASGGAVSADPMTAVVEQWDAVRATFAAGALDGGAPLDETALGPPVPAPRAVYAVGLNYAAHAAEGGREPPPIPGIFTKFPTSINGPYGDVVLPSVGGKASNDWEAELAVVFGDGGRDLAADDALDHVRGFLCAQDISERFTQFEAMAQFSMGKSFDTFCPIGPAIVTLDELAQIADPHDLAITCTVNGVVKQDSRTSDLIFDVPALTAFISSICTIRAGDLLLTGTPSGVGIARGEKLEPGDVIVTEIEGLGRLRNTCVS